MSYEMQPCSSTSGGTAYTQKNCIVNTATGVSEEIISMQSGGAYGPIYYTKSQAGVGAGTAFTQRGFTRNANGDLYPISGSGGMPRQINNPNPYYGTPVTSADPQDFEYLSNVAPGSGAFKKMTTYVGGWWMNIFGLNKEPTPKINAEEVMMSDSKEAEINPRIGLLTGVVATIIGLEYLRRR